jgi:hypothetical protein
MNHNEDQNRKREEAFVDRVFKAFGFEFKKKAAEVNGISIEAHMSKMAAAMERMEVTTQQLRHEIASLKRAVAPVL